MRHFFLIAGGALAACTTAQPGVSGAAPETVTEVAVRQRIEQARSARTDAERIEADRARFDALAAQTPAGLPKVARAAGGAPVAPGAGAAAPAGTMVVGLGAGDPHAGGAGVPTLAPVAEPSPMGKEPLRAPAPSRVLGPGESMPAPYFGPIRGQTESPADLAAARIEAETQRRLGAGH